MTATLPPRRSASALWRSVSTSWRHVSTSFLPFADVASADLPLGRLLRLSLFQVSVGMALALTVGTLNRVLIVELGTAATLVSAMVALPILFAPFRALVGFKSDTHRSLLGWRRVPYIWFGSLIQFGGLAIMPFALLVLSGDNNAPVVVGQIATAIAFLLIGIGLQTTQTAGLALATDLAAEDARPRVVALMYVMLLFGMFVSSVIFGLLLIDFTPLRLIQTIQGAAVVTMVLNVIALWKQEARDPARNQRDEDRPTFREAWGKFAAAPGAKRFLVAVALGTAAFSMQDILLEPYGGEVLNLGVGQTSLLTALFAGAALAAFALAARLLAKGRDAYRLAAHGVLVGIPGFAAIILAGPVDSPLLFRIGAIVIGFGSGLFSVATLAAAMSLDVQGRAGLALGAWGAVQATAAGAAIGLGGLLRDTMSAVAMNGSFGAALTSPTTGYGLVYNVEVLLLFATLVAIGPLARHAARDKKPSSTRFGLAEFPT
jgi:MFS transporter, BCD family, chlorophyll transporter